MTAPTRTDPVPLSRARATTAGVGRAWRWLRPQPARAPATLIYLFTLLVTQLTLHTIDDRLGHRLLISESTNLHNMTHAPVQVLLGSAFWTGTNPLTNGLTLVEFLLVMIPAEAWLGTRRWLASFAAGHLGATLITLAITAAALHRGTITPAVAHDTDVGVSYGLFAVAGVLTYRLPRPIHRVGWVAAIATAFTIALILNHDLADVGHLSALGIGLGLYPLTRHLPTQHRPVPERAHPQACPARSAPPIEEELHPRTERAHGHVLG